MTNIRTFYVESIIAVSSDISNKVLRCFVCFIGMFINYINHIKLASDWFLLHIIFIRMNMTQADAT